jgi:hypothetical protein
MGHYATFLGFVVMDDLPDTGRKLRRNGAPVPQNPRSLLPSA